MNLTSLKLTPAQALIINAILSLLGTAGIGGISAAYQYYVLHGLNAGILINLMLATFLGLFGKALHDYVPAHARDLIQALKDSETQARTGFQEALDHMTAQQPVQLTQTSSASPQGPLVVIHTTQAALTSAPNPVSQPIDTISKSVRLLSTSVPTTIPVDPLATPGMIPVVQPANNTLQHVTQPVVQPGTATYVGDTWTRVQAAATAGQQ